MNWEFQVVVLTKNPLVSIPSSSSSSNKEEETAVLADELEGDKRNIWQDEPNNLPSPPIYTTYLFLTILTWGFSAFVYLLSSFIPFVVTLKEANEFYYNLFAFNKGSVVFNVLFNIFASASVVFSLLRIKRGTTGKEFQLLSWEQTTTVKKDRKPIVLWPLFYCAASGLDLVFWVCKLAVGSFACSVAMLIISLLAYIKAGNMIPINGTLCLKDMSLQITILYAYSLFNLFQKAMAMGIEFEWDGFIDNFQLSASLFMGVAILLANLTPSIYFIDEALPGILGFFALLLGIEHQGNLEVDATQYYWVVAVTSGGVLLLLSGSLLIYKQYIIETNKK
jgi:hypothetical protein